MKNPIVLALLVLGALYIWQDSRPSSNPPKPLFEEPYVAVYGRNSCGFTQNTLRNLKQSNISYRYFSVDSAKVADELHPRMQQSGLDIRRYNLPVVDVNGKLRIRPSNSDIIMLQQSN